MTLLEEGKSADGLRAVLAGWLVRKEGCTPSYAVQKYGVGAVLSACEREGVVSLVHARVAEIAASHAVPGELTEGLLARARTSAARSLLCVSEARRVQRALDEAAIPTIWLKGVALADWLYPAPMLRDYADIDLLLPDHATMLRAAEVLASSNYVLVNPHIAGDMVVHELLAWSEQWHLELDLHWDVCNAALFANRLKWAELRAQAIPLSTLGEAALGLGPVHSLLHACIHRAVNHLTGREDNLRWLYDIHLLAGSLSPAHWDDACALAEARGLATICHDGLVSSSRWLGTRVPVDVVDKLRSRAATEPLTSAQLRRWSGFQLATWRALEGQRQRLRWLRQLLLPDMAHLRVRYGADNAGAVRILARRVHDGIMRWRGYAATK